MTTIDVRIDSIAAGGDGVARHDGMVVFVPRSAPGDLARVDARQQGRLMRGRLIDVLEPSRERVSPACEHYTRDKCGGCQIQHLDYSSGQIPAKSRIIHDALTRIGKLDLQAPPDVEASPKEWRYRTKLTLALRRSGSAWIAGLRRYDDPDAVFDLRDCPITEERVLHAWKAVLAQQELLPRAASLRGAVRLLGTGFSFTLEGGIDWRQRDRFFESVAGLAQLWWRPEGKGRELVASRQSEEAGASFTQINPAVAARLREWVMQLATAARPGTAVDAYAGTGDIAVALAEQGAQVTAIEIDRAASRLCAQRLPQGSRAVAAPVEHALPRALPADLVVLNPPRTGLDERVPPQIQAAKQLAGTLIYVSCNPATLARDIRRLDRYRVRSLRGFDMFPQTAHVETVCELVPAA
jgi:23S rRNA (uracil1939-C5)-methyltransferase